MTNHDNDIAQAKAKTMQAMFHLLGAIKRFDFDQRPDAAAVRNAYDALECAMLNLIGDAK